MKKIFIFILFVFIITCLSAQDWSEPINISNMDNTDIYPNIVFTSDNFLNVVWTHVVDNLFSKIYYSISDDNGETWSLPEDISQNYEHKCIHPKIASDSQDNLYLIYELNTGDWTETAVYFHK